jgi:hypothetical protein
VDYGILRWISVDWGSWALWLSLLTLAKLLNLKVILTIDSVRNHQWTRPIFAFLQKSTDFHRGIRWVTVRPQFSTENYGRPFYPAKIIDHAE